MPMSKILVVIIIFAAALSPGQSSSSKYQSARILEVEKQPQTASDKNSGSTVDRYHVTLRVSDTDYVVEYIPAPGAYGFQYRAGLDILVLVEDKTITFNDLLGRSIKVPIISKKPAPPRNSR